MGIAPIKDLINRHPLFDYRVKGVGYGGALSVPSVIIILLPRRPALQV